MAGLYARLCIIAEIFISAYCPASLPGKEDGKEEGNQAQDKLHPAQCHAGFEVYKK